MRSQAVSLENKRVQQLCGLPEDCRQPDLREEGHSLALQTAEQGPLGGSLGRQILSWKEGRVSRIVKEAQSHNSCFRKF